MRQNIARTGEDHAGRAWPRPVGPNGTCLGGGTVGANAPGAMIDSVNYFAYPFLMTEVGAGYEVSDRVAVVRRFNRFYTHAIGLLEDGLLDSDFSLAEARVLYELANRPAPSAAEIARDLGLDPGYLSRILQRFVRKGLLVREVASDRRRSLLRLTEAGRAAFAPLDAASRREIAQLLDPLPDPAQTALVEAMRRIECTLSAARGAGEIALRPHGAGDIGWVIARHGALYAEEYGFDETFEGFVAQVAGQFLIAHDPARERCWIAERNGIPLGTVSLMRGSDQVGKLRLLIVEPSARGLGIGRLLVETCVDFAREAGYARLTLWTQSILTAARAIYRRSGFRLTRSEPHRSFGCDLVGENWELDLS